MAHDCSRADNRTAMILPVAITAAIAVTGLCIVAAWREGKGIGRPASRAASAIVIGATWAGWTLAALGLLAVGGWLLVDWLS